MCTKLCEKKSTGEREEGGGVKSEFERIYGLFCIVWGKSVD